MPRLNQLTLLGVLSITSLLQAEVIRQPPSLATGDQYRLAFITSEKRTAESDDIESYNDFVQAIADAAPEVGQWALAWNAIAGTETVSARENTATDPISNKSVPIFLVNGTELVPSYSALWNLDIDPLLGDFIVNELGETMETGLPASPYITVWTGTSPRGTIFFTGQNIGGPLGLGPNAIIGFADAGSPSWFLDTARPLGSNHRMYAISENLTAVPEPNKSTYLLTLLAIGLLVRKRT